jgi:hypothetical protein
MLVAILGLWVADIRGILRAPGRQVGLLLFFRKVAVSGYAVASLALGTVKGRICHFDQLYGVARVVRERRYADADGDLVLFVRTALADHAEPVVLDGQANTLGRDQTLSQVGIQQKGRELIPAEPRRGISAPEVCGYRKSYFFDGLAAGKMAELVIDPFKVVSVHHQDAKRTLFFAGPARLTPKLRKERAARKQTRQIVMRDKPVYLPLILTVDLVKQVEPQHRKSYLYLVPVLERLSPDTPAVQKCTVSRIEIGQQVARCIALPDAGNARMLPRDLRVVDANIRLECPSENDIFALERYRHGYKLTAQENKRRLKVTASGLDVVH